MLFIGYTFNRQTINGTKIIEEYQTFDTAREALQWAGETRRAFKRIGYGMRSGNAAKIKRDRFGRVIL